MTGSQAGKVAIVTGGSANLGKLFAESLASDGANVQVHYNSPKRADEAQSTVSELTSRGVEAASHQADLTSLEEILHLVDATIERFGRWDILVNTSGVIVRKPLAETTGDLGDPADVVPVMRFLAAPETRWVTAQTVYVNGGMIAPIS